MLFFGRGLWKKSIFLMCLASVVLLPLAAGATVKKTPLLSTTDHGKHAVLQKDFSTPEEVTAACLTCHNEAANQIHKTLHWTWRAPASAAGKEGKEGKGGLTFNNFCIAIPTNEARCTSCHIGFGWKNNTFDFTSQNSVDCIVCHDATGTYKKFPTAAGYPVVEKKVFEGKTFTPPDYKRIAASVGKPGRENCGSCHFYGGGGDAVKHGDIDSSLASPSRKLDVHLSPDGGDFSCQRCHTTQAHDIAGRKYATPAFAQRTPLTKDDTASRIACESCHTPTPHPAGHKANDHTDKVSCQACHIPAFARELPTKTAWDWSTAGKKKDGKPYVEKGDHGMTIYDSKKGDFIWQKNVTPVYRWYSGRMEHMLLTDVADPSKPIEITKIIGDPSDPGSRIMPFKEHRGKQPFDVQNKTFVVPHLFGADDAAYWKNYDWKKAVEAGQKSLGLPFSGEYAFVDTLYYYPTTHMVAPKEDGVACVSCHSRDSLLQGVEGVWMPGRDAHPLVDWLGRLFVVGALGGVGVHGSMRYLIRRKKK